MSSKSSAESKNTHMSVYTLDIETWTGSLKKATDWRQYTKKIDSLSETNTVARKEFADAQERGQRASIIRRDVNGFGTLLDESGGPAFS